MYRYCIYPKEIAIILGKSYTHSCQLVRTIKDAHGKSSHQPITIKEFCDYMDLPYEDIFNMINGHHNRHAS
ncbi:hypothetical protein [Yeosuana aromativorans]|uniref:hypothetical protein n=1 Tax=Yeosuana aromativorans TaxID=288019 RepID=UPI001669E649|nr:hypothetical protein [Yeosuana aromativorans]